MYDKALIQKLKEEFKHLTIQNDFMFYHVMKHKHLCEELLTRFLGRKITILEISPQATIAPSLKSKSVRLDILAKDDEGNLYNIEMQISNNDSIPRRMRIYQASIDLDFFKKNTRYKDATDTIIIFICMFDPIGEGLPIYTFKNLCEQNPKIELGDGTLKMIVVPKEWEKSDNKEIKSVLRYIYENIATDAYTKELDMQVADIKYDEVISNESLSYFFKMQDEREEGIKEGMQKGMQKGMQRGMQKGMIEGEKNTKLSIARIMKREACPISLIIKTTGLSERDIEML